MIVRIHLTEWYITPVIKTAGDYYYRSGVFKTETYIKAYVMFLCFTIFIKK